MNDSRRRLAGIPAALMLTVIAGCGGGGGGDYGGPPPAPDTIVIGKVVSSDGNPAPGARVTVQYAGSSDTTLAGGGYRLVNVPSGVQRLYATATINGAGYSGTTQVLAVPHATVSNANILIAPNSRQATVDGQVVDNNGRSIEGARVFLANNAPSSGNVMSDVAFTDRSGFFSLQRIPATGANYSLAVSTLGFENLTLNVNGLTAGEHRSLTTIQLSPSFNQGALVPQNVAAEAFTQPGAAPTSELKAHSAQQTASAYEGVRRLASPKYAARIASNAHAASRITSQHVKSKAAGSGDYAIEMDVFFDETSRDSLSGFRIYNSADTNAVTPYDFLQDPLTNIYVDLDPLYTPDRQFNFAVSAINTDGTETQKSPTVSVVPLGRVYLNQPAAFSVHNSPVTVAWTQVNGAQAYDIYVYNQFPSVQTAPVVTVSNIAASQSSQTLTTLGPGSYWIVVAATADSGAEVSLTQFTPFDVQ